MDAVSSPFTLIVSIISSSPLNSSCLFFLDNGSLLKCLKIFGFQLICKNGSLKSWLDAVFTWDVCVLMVGFIVGRIGLSLSLGTQLSVSICPLD